MADTIFGSFVEGYKGGTEVQHASEQARAETSLLSSRAELAKSQVESQRQAQATAMATRAAKTKAGQTAKDADVSTSKGQIQILDLAINANKDQPEVVEGLLKQKQEAQHAGAQATLDQATLRQEERAQIFDSVRDAFAEPSTGLGSVDSLISTTADPETKQRLVGLKQIISGAAPIKNSTGQLVSYNALTPDEQKDFQDRVLTKLGPSKMEETAHQAQKDKLDWARLEEQRRKNDLISADKEKAEATKREKIEKTATKAESESKIAADMAKAEEAHTRTVDRMETELYGDGSMVHPGIPETIPNPKSTFYNKEPAEIPNPVYEKKKAAIESAKEKHTARMEKLEAASKGPDPVDKDKATIAFGSYEPNKYEYGINPATGKFARKLKGT